MDDKEKQFAEELAKYPNQWVAIDMTDAEKKVVGVGEDAEEASREAEDKGYPEAFLFKVFPYEGQFIPSA